MKNTTVIARNEAISELWQSGNGRSVIRYLSGGLIAFFLLFSVNTMAQSKDTTHLQFRGEGRSLPNPTKPLIVLDGVPYSGIPNPADIKQISLLKGDVATALYGSQAALGVIFVTTKNDKGHWSLNNPDKTTDLFIDTNALYIMDGKVLPSKLNGIDLQNILSISIIKHVACDSCYVNTGDHGAVIIITKEGAIKSYQKKFSAFSKEYRTYFDNPQNNDSDFLYVVNGVPANIKTNEGIKTLSDIRTLKIKEVIFKDKGSILNNIKPIVVITTKK